jgi:carboxymethylenebutenolidase
MGEMIAISKAPGEADFKGYLARPEAGRGPGLVVIQEIFGVNEGVRRKCDAFAEAGFVALAPDLFWRLDPGVTFDPDDPQQLQDAIALVQTFDRDAGVRDIATTIALLRADLDCTGKVGAVGYCMGGTLAYLASTRTDVDASVGYYASFVETLLDESASIKAPLVLHIPVDDFFVGPESQRMMHKGLDANPLVTLHDYQGADHGFAEFGKRRNEAAATLADARTLAFLHKYLT